MGTVKTVPLRDGIRAPETHQLHPSVAPPSTFLAHIPPSIPLTSLSKMFQGPPVSPSCGLTWSLPELTQRPCRALPLRELGPWSLHVPTVAPRE